MALDLTLENVLSPKKNSSQNNNVLLDQRKEKDTVILKTKKLTIIEFIQSFNFKRLIDYQEGINCDCCGVKLKEFDRYFNLCGKCHRELEKKLPRR